MAQFFRHARKLQNAQNILQQRPASTVYFSSDVAAAFVSREVGKGNAEANIAVGCSLTTKASTTVLSLSRLIRNTTKTSILMPSLRFISVVPCTHAASVRYYSDNSASIANTVPHTKESSTGTVQALNYSVTPISQIRKLTVSSLLLSMQNIPRYPRKVDICVDKFMQLHGELNSLQQASGEKHISVNDQVIKDIAITVEEEQDPEKLKNYKVSASSAPPAEAHAPSETAIASPEEQEPAKAPEPRVSQAEATPNSEDRIFSSPLARKLAEVNKVPLSSLKGTGSDGQILKADPEDYLASIANTVPHTKESSTGTVQALNYSVTPISQIRKLTVSSLLLSMQNIPRYPRKVDICVDKFMQLYGELNSLQQASGEKHISVNDQEEKRRFEEKNRQGY